MLRSMDKSKTQHDFKGLTDFFHGFKSGLRKDSQGRSKTWTHDELDEIVANTNARIEKNMFSGAPFVVGHPKTNDPAYGWTKNVKRDGDTLLIKGDEATLHKEFADGVESGLWPNRSIRIGKGKDGFYLAHVGFLGAAPPAVDGMDAVYAADEGEFFDYADNDTYTPNVLVRTLRRFREYIINKDDIETADNIIPDHEIESLGDHVNRLREENNPNQPTTSFNKPDSEGDKTMSDFTQADIDAAVEKARKDERTKVEGDFSKQLSDKDTELKGEREQRLRADFTKQVDDLVTANKITPAQSEGMVDFMLQLADGEATEFEFSAGEGDKKTTFKKTPVAFFTDFVSKIGKQVDTGETDFTDGDLDFNGDANAMAKAATDYQAEQELKGVTVSASDAVAHVTKGAKQ